MSLLFDERPVPIWARTKAGIPLPRVSFGAPSKLDEPGGWNFELTSGDRAIFEQAVRDAASNQPNYERMLLAREALTGALRTAGGPIIGSLLAFAGDKLLNLLGFGVVVNVGENAGATMTGSARWGFSWTTEYPYIVRSVVTRAHFWTPAPNKFSVEIDVANHVEKWEFGYHSSNPEEGRYFAAGGGAGIAANGSGVASSAMLNYGPNPPTAKGEWNPPPYGQVSTTSQIDNPGDPLRPYWADKFRYAAYDQPCDSNATYQFFVVDRIASPDDYFIIDPSPINLFGKEMRCGDESLQEFELPPLEDFRLDPSTLDPGDSDITPGEMQDELIPRLRDSEWWEKYGTPYDEPPTQELPGEPHPSDPSWPCNPGGGGRVPRVVIGGPGMRVPRPPGFDPPGMPGDEMCVIVGGKRVCGKIRRMPGPGEDIIVEQPPYRDERFTKHWCPKKGRLIVDLVKQLAGELGFKPGDTGWIVDGDCKKRWPGGCFKKGSSKFDAMWRLADMCGYALFPEPPHIGPIKPLPPDPRTYGPYHEYRDLFVFEAVKDDLDIPSHVEVYVPNFPRQRGYSVVVEVDTPYKLKDKWLRIRAPKRMSEADAMDWAAKRARRYEIITKLTDFAIPYEHGQYARQRTQMKLRIPSEGYDGRFMVWEFSHDIDIDGGAVTKIRGIELSRQRYAPRFENYQEVWENAPAGYGVMS